MSVVLSVVEDPWSWNLSNVLAAAQVILVLLGFGVSISQLIRTANATVASKALLEKVRSRLVGNDLLVALPELQKLEDDLFEHLKAPDPVGMERTFRIYARATGRVVSLLKMDATTEADPLVALLASAASAVQTAKGELAEGTTRDLSDVVRVAMKRIGAVSMAASGLIVKLERRVGD